MDNQYDYLKLLKEPLGDLLNSIESKLEPAEFELLKEFNDVGEYQLALEQIAGTLFACQISIDRALFEAICRLASEMQLAMDEFLQLEMLVTK